MPESLTCRENAAHVRRGCPASPRNGVRLHVGMASGFTLESCPASRRNVWPASLGICSACGDKDDISKMTPEEEVLLLHVME